MVSGHNYRFIAVSVYVFTQYTPLIAVTMRASLPASFRQGGEIQEGPGWSETRLNVYGAAGTPAARTSAMDGGGRECVGHNFVAEERIVQSDSTIRAYTTRRLHMYKTLKVYTFSRALEDLVCSPLHAKLGRGGRHEGVELVDGLVIGWS